MAPTMRLGDSGFARCLNFGDSTWPCFWSLNPMDTNCGKGTHRRYFPEYMGCRWGLVGCQDGQIASYLGADKWTWVVAETLELLPQVEWCAKDWVDVFCFQFQDGFSSQTIPNHSHRSSRANGSVCRSPGMMAKKATTRGFWIQETDEALHKPVISQLARDSTSSDVWNSDFHTMPTWRIRKTVWVLPSLRRQRASWREEWEEIIFSIKITRCEKWQPHL